MATIVEVYVKDIDTENKKISLGYKKTEDNPWEVLQDETTTSASVVTGQDRLHHCLSVHSLRSSPVLTA